MDPSASVDWSAVRQKEAEDEFSLMGKTEIIEKILSLQSTLSALTQKAESVRADNISLKAENETLKEYIDNLMGKVGSLSGLGTSTLPSEPRLARGGRSAAQVVRVNNQIGDLTAGQFEGEEED